MKTFSDKVAAITGAGSGIGRSLALALAGRKCHVALSDIDAEGLAETARLAAARGIKVTTAPVDVAKRQQVEDWATQVVADHGRVNLIFNNAGVALGSSVEGMKYEDFEWLMGINFWGVVYGTKAFLPHIKAAGEGCVVNTSSVFGLVGIPSQSAYNAAKFAVRGFTESLRQELVLQHSPIGALTVHPGGIKTNIAKSARMDRSVGDLGLDTEHSTEKFEKAFITTPDKAARVILNAVQHNRSRVLVGPDAHAIDWMVRSMPSLYQKVTVAFARRSMR